MLQTKHLFLTAGFVSTLILGGNVLATSTIAKAETVQSHTPALIAQTPQLVAQGSFVKAEAPTTGKAKIVRENGKTYLEIDQAFSTTDQAPDLHVLLDPNATPPKTYSNMNSYVNLGKLQKVKGSQRYPVPSAINLSGFKSVVIWCRMANATMGYASLK